MLAIYSLYLINVNCIRLLRHHQLRPLSQESTRKLAASIFIQSQCLNEMQTLAVGLQAQGKTIQEHACWDLIKASPLVHKI